MNVQRLFFLCFLTTVFLVRTGFCYSYSGGTGQPANPYKIATVNDLLYLAGDTNDYDYCFIMTNDINLADYNFTSAVIAIDNTSSFTGVFDGNNRTISNLKINDSSSFTGLFGSANRASIMGVNIQDCNIIAGASTNNIAGLVGWAYKTPINNCTVSGIITAENYCSYIGGITGYNGYGSTISDCYTNVNIVSKDDSFYTGGITGYNYSADITDTIADGNVTGDNRIGGLIGENRYGSIINCHAKGDVSSYMTYWSGYVVGGLIGWFENGTITNCSAIGDLSGGLDCVSLGGLIGHAKYGTISYCYATGKIEGGDKSVYMGGLIGRNENAAIDNCYAHGDVIGGVLSKRHGGLVGQNGGTITKCYSAGAPYGSESIGGLVGMGASANVSYSFWNKDSCSHLTYSAGGTGITETQMKTAATFTGVGWDFVSQPDGTYEDIWRMCLDEVVYPKLWWEYITGDIACNDGVNLIDFAILADNWFGMDSDTDWYDNADINNDNQIEILDLALLCAYWLE